MSGARAEVSTLICFIVLIFSSRSCLFVLCRASPCALLLLLDLDSGAFSNAVYYAVYAVYAISSLDTGSPLRHRTQHATPSEHPGRLFMLFMQ